PTRAPPTACWMVRLTSRERSCSRSQTDRSASRQPAVFGGIWGRRLLVFRRPRERPTACLLLFPLERVRALGAEPVVEGDRVSAQLASRPLDAVIDTIGGGALESTCEALRPNGIIVSVVRAPDETYLRSKGVRAAYFIV